MLSRTAANLYWTGRYVERADATARLLSMGERMTMLPGAAARGDWQSVLQAAGVALPEEELVGRREAIGELLLAPEGGSIRACLTAARANARAERTALTTQMWEALNDDWRALEGVTEGEASQDLLAHIDWTHRRAAAFKGATETTMLRDDRYDFLALGGLIERAAMTLRLLDVKYLALLPERDVVGGGRDLHQWTSLLLAASALRAFHHAYRGDVTARGVADLLVLNQRFPRSVALCVRDAATVLDRLGDAYERSTDAQARAGTMRAHLTSVTMDEIFSEGLHEFVQDTLAGVLAIHDATAAAYGF